MIGIAGIYGAKNGSDAIRRIQSVHEIEGVHQAKLVFHDKHISACLLMRDDLAAWESAGCRYEDRQFAVLIEGMLAVDGPLAGVAKDRIGERICALWKRDPGFLSDLNGEYVFVLYNKLAGELVIANDRYGTRPFFYSRSGGVLRFGSEIKSLLATGMGPELDHAGLMEFFTLSHNMGDRTIYLNIKALPPASILRFDRNGLTLNPYWKLGFSHSGKRNDLQHLMRRAAKTLRAGASSKINGRKHLGMGLSGGLDSRLVADLIPGDGMPVFARTFGDMGSDEVRAARMIATRLGFDHHVHQPSETHFFSFLHPSVWRTECRVHFTGLKSIIEHHRLKDKYWYNLNGHFGDVLTGKQLRPFMFLPMSREHFIKKIFNHYTWYTYRDQNLLKTIFNADFFSKLFPQVKAGFFESFISIEEENNWDAYDVWDLTNRQPRFTFSSCAVDNYLFGKASLLTDYHYVDIMLKVPGIYRFGQAFYKAMIARHFPEIAKVPNANTGKRLSRSIVRNWGDLSAQYRKAQRNRKKEAGTLGGKADLFRKDKKLKTWLLSQVDDNQSLTCILAPEGVRRVVKDHYDNGQDRSYILGVLATFLAAYELFFKNEVGATPQIADPGILACGAT